MSARGPPPSFAWERRMYFTRGWFFANLARDDEYRFTTGRERSRARLEAAAIRRRLKQVGEGPCSACGTEQGPFELDHIVPIVANGLSDPSNLRWLCVRCHRHVTYWGFLPGRRPPDVTCGDKRCLHGRWRHDRTCWSSTCREWYTCSEGHVHRTIERHAVRRTTRPRLGRFSW